MDRYEETKLRIKEATDLVALIESYMPLKLRGRDYMARCPFHAENTASFSVSREKQFYHCFGCGAHGDVFTWLMERDGLSFREAMEVLAERTGISLEGVFKERGERRRPSGPNPHDVLTEIAGFFGQQLLESAGAQAHEYLVERGLEAAIQPWGIGYHPEQRGALVAFCKEHKLPRRVVEDAGLLKNGKEAFAGRVIFPIADERGRIVAFGGRVVPGSRHAAGSGDFKPPKYLNSPESPIFNKRRVLFGLPHVKRAGERRLLVMEGYTDVIACHLAGFHGAVATLGTAFTTDHARLVERYATEGLVLMFDGDRAGRNAAARAMRELVNSRLGVRMAVMSDAGDDIKDPADLVVARPGDDPELVDEQRVRFADIIDGAEDSLTVWFRLLRDRLDLREATNVEKAAGECVEILQLVDNPVKQAALRQEMASHLAVPEPTLERLMARAPKRRYVEPPQPDIPRRGEPQGGSSAAGQVPDFDAINAQIVPEGMVDGAGGMVPEVGPNGEPIEIHGAAGGSGDGGSGGGGSGDGGAGGGGGSPVARSLRERADVELLACVLARPTLLGDAPGITEERFDFAPARELLGLAADGLALGRTASNDLAQYLFARVTETPALRGVLASAARRSETIPDVVALWAGLTKARGKMRREPEMRDLRQELKQALEAGDRARAEALQAQLLATKRQDTPRVLEPEFTDSGVSSTDADAPAFLRRRPGTASTGAASSSGAAASSAPTGNSSTDSELSVDESAAFESTESPHPSPDDPSSTAPGDA